jgi:hypothetical protein
MGLMALLGELMALFGNVFFFTGTHSEATEEGRKRHTKEEEEGTTTATNIQHHQ